MFKKKYRNAIKVGDFWVTEEPFTNEYKGSCTDYRLIEELHDEALHPSYHTVQKLETAIKKWPGERSFYNYLSIVHEALGNDHKYEQIVYETLERFPEYLFPRIQLAQLALKRGDFHLVPQHFGPAFELRALYPDRELFHFTEVRGYYYLVCQYAYQVENQELLEKASDYLSEALPDSEISQITMRMSLLLSVKSSMERMKSDEQSTFEIEEKNTTAYEKRTEQPTFQLDITKRLYNTKGNRMPISEAELADLPHEAFVDDLILVLKDCIQRFEWFLDNMDEFDNDGQSFAFHALRYLGFLKAKRAIPVVLDVLRQGSDFLEYWFYDPTHVFYEPLFWLCKEEPQILADFILEKNVGGMAKDPAIQVLEQIGLQDESKRAEVLGYFDKTVDYLLKNVGNSDAFDSKTLLYVFSSLISYRAKAFLPRIKQAFDSKIVGVGFLGDYEEVEKEMNKDWGLWEIKPVAENLEEFYSDAAHSRKVINPEFTDIMNRLDSPNEKKRLKILENMLEGDIGLNMPRQTTKFVKKKKKIVAPSKEDPYRHVGKNAPCPCGSGKKFKRCHGV